MEKGKISVQTENIFPIIKKFLYSEQEVFLRELVSNAVDATTKMQVLSSKGLFKGELGELNIQIEINKDQKTLHIRDRGVGMDEAEVKKYLNQVAFSSAEEFIEKYKADANIIGHFGLGFYSAFMVADKVEVITKSYQEDAQAVKWTCHGDTEFVIEPHTKSDRGTEVILYISDSASEFLEEYKINSLLDKFCKFLPIPIQFGTTKEKIKEGDAESEITKPRIINNTSPLWKKTPSDLTDEDYKSFYQELYPYSTEPMFWIHLNIDYPFNLTGVLYFPKLKNQFEIQKNKIHLYCNQVFVTDDAKDVVPEFLMLLHGVIDSPDIPLNVSRSYLQADANVRKISNYITKKVAEKLNELFKKDRPDFEKKWSDVGTFIKYGFISDEKFAEKAIDFMLIENIENKFFTIEEYKKHIDANQKDKNKNLIALYTTDPTAQYSYVAQCKERGYDIALLNNIIDNHFIQHLEYKQGLSFKRVDSDTIDKLIEQESATESVLNADEVKTIENLFKESPLNTSHQTEMKAMSPNDPPLVIVRPEFMRRMSEMQMMMQLVKGENEGNLFADQFKIIINSNHPIVCQTLLKKEDKERREMADYLIRLALLEQNMLKGEQLHSFIKDSIARLQ